AQKEKKPEQAASTADARPETPKDQPPPVPPKEHPASPPDASLSPSANASSRPASIVNTDERSAKDVFINQSLTLPFSLPTSTDMLVTYGAGFGGTNRERARKYIPTVPPEVLSRLDREL
ncbi:DIL and Ankyrin, partial [Aspergillus sclerotialis]